MNHLFFIITDFSNLCHAQKWKDRCDICTIMIEVCRKRGDTRGVSFWEYRLLTLGHLGDGGMSEEEEGIQVVRKHGRAKKKKIKVIKDLFFRHPSFTKLFQRVDATPDAKETVFHRKGKPRKMRQCVQEFSFRGPPTKLSQTIFQGEYLHSLAPYQIADLELSSDSFPIFSFDNDS
ncbi:hypothetical protein GYMLUDRAFT_179387 [Collybiopsis luxurians FD-317 M1]|uniref:Uncharacterized protein n=1 Tax=Collybiopsis luxurians FD-317 M1 TaxID=944289 RepID=A0A0D0BES3_9AGAR|nr:hypothetical protein GYMLUDRAFT_179387 [Collybiopsis luxurians FD-317 M1]